MGGSFFRGSVEWLEERLLADLDAARTSDPLAPQIVIVGSNLARLYLRRRLAQGRPHINIRMLLFRDLALALAGNDLLAAGSRPLPAEAPLALCRRLAAEIPDESEFAPMRPFPGFPRALAATFADIEEAGLSVLPVPAGPHSGRIAELSRLYAAYRQGLSRWHDTAELLASAAERAERYGSVFGTDRLHLYGIYDMNPVQERLLRALAHRVELRCYVPGGYGAGREPRRLGALLEELGLTVEAGPAAVTVDTVIVSGADSEQEARETLRLLFAYLRRGGDPAEVCIMLRDPRYAALYAELLESVGLPFHSSWGTMPASLPAAGSMLALLRLAAGGLERRDLMDLLDLMPWDPEWLKRERVELQPALWELLTRETGAMRGADELRSGMRRLLGRCRYQCRRHPDDERLAERLKAAEGLQRIASKVLDVVGKLPARGSWTAHVEALRPALALLDPACGLDRLREGLDELAALDAIVPEVTLADFTETLKARWERTRMPQGRFQLTGVNICDLMAARGTRFELVILPGMLDGVFPRSPRQDPLLRDAERQAVNRELGGDLLSLRGDDTGEELLLFEMACGAARERTILSYPRSSESRSGERRPSSLVFARAECLAGERLRQEDLAALPFFYRVPLQPAPVDPDSCLDASERDRAVALAAARQGDVAPLGLFSDVCGFLPRALYAHQSRWSSEMTLFDGEGLLPASFLDRVLSATALEEYAKCPFKFLLHRVMGLEPVDEPEVALEMNVMDRGTLMHDLLASLYQELASGGLLPLREATLSEALERLEAVLRTRLPQVPEEHPVGPEVIWELDRERVRLELREHLRREAEAGERLVPSRFEVEFGRGDEEPLAVRLPDGSEMRFRGRIDRVDISPGGDGLRVVDYKTGKKTAQPGTLKGGEQLQAAIYLLAALRLPEAADAGELASEYVYLSEEVPERKRRVSFEAAGTQEVLKRLAEVLGPMKDLMLKGYYLWTGDCRPDGCDYRHACPVERAALYRRKSSHQLVEGFEEMKEID
ncbi:MAG: PD-(D/E)XK nuclease family protein [Candidatus Geothermincolia bacterium]